MSRRTDLMQMLSDRVQHGANHTPGLETLCDQLAHAVDGLLARVEELELQINYDGMGIERPPVGVAWRCDGCGIVAEFFHDEVCEDCGSPDFSEVMSGEPCVTPNGNPGQWSRDGRCVA